MLLGSEEKKYAFSSVFCAVPKSISVKVVFLSPSPKTPINIQVFLINGTYFFVFFYSWLVKWIYSNIIPDIAHAFSKKYISSPIFFFHLICSFLFLYLVHLHLHVLLLFLPLLFVYIVHCFS